MESSDFMIAIAGILAVFVGLPWIVLH